MPTIMSLFERDSNQPLELVEKGKSTTRLEERYSQEKYLKCCRGFKIDNQLHRLSLQVLLQLQHHSYSQTTQNYNVICLLCIAFVFTSHMTKSTNTTSYHSRLSCGKSIRSPISRVAIISCTNSPIRYRPMLIKLFECLLCHISPWMWLLVCGKTQRYSFHRPFQN